VYSAALADQQQQQQQQQQQSLLSQWQQHSRGEHLPAAGSESARCFDDISLNCSLRVLLPAHEVELHMLQRNYELTRVDATIVARATMRQMSVLSVGVPCQGLPESTRSYIKTSTQLSQLAGPPGLTQCCHQLCCPITSCKFLRSCNYIRERNGDQQAGL
jgi:hypothetical protein